MNLETLARPYVRAMFEHSEGWSKDLNLLEEAVNNPKIDVLINSPHLAYKEKVGVLVALFRGQVESKTINFLKVLGSSKRQKDSLAPSRPQQRATLALNKGPGPGQGRPVQESVAVCEPFAAAIMLPCWRGLR